jgi:succinoglycan biosynthesis transport protein ExoP
MVMQAGVQPDRQLSAAAAAAIDIGIGALGPALWRKKFLIVGLTLLTAAVAFAGINIVTPRYKSELRVLIEMRKNVFFGPKPRKIATGPPSIRKS